MHYTEGARSDTIAPFSTVDQHVDQNLPATAGTTVSAEFLNALMFEVANVIEHAGLTIEPDSVTDRSNGFAQLLNAIFGTETIDTPALADEAVTSSKIYAVDLEKLAIGQADLEYVSGNVTYHLDIDTDSYQFLLRFIETDSGTSEEDQTTLNAHSLILRHYDSSDLTYYALLDSEKILIRDYSAPGVESGRAQLATDGLFFLESNKSVKHSVIDMSSLSFAYDGASSEYYVAAVTTIPDTAVVLMAQYTFLQTGGIYRMVNHTDAASIKFKSNGGFLQAYVRYTSDPTSLILSDEYLTIIYSDT